MSQVYPILSASDTIEDMKSSYDFSDYIKSEPPIAKKYLKQMRGIIRKAAPQATEKLAWGMPTFHQDGNLVHFCTFKAHMSLFPGSEAMSHFKKDLVAFQTSKGTIQIPYGLAIPAALVTRIVKFCIKQNAARVEAKKKAKAAKKKKPARK